MGNCGKTANRMPEPHTLYLMCVWWTIPTLNYRCSGRVRRPTGCRSCQCLQCTWLFGVDFCHSFCALVLGVLKCISPGWVLLMAGLGLTTLHTSIVGSSGGSEPPIKNNKNPRKPERSEAPPHLASPLYHELIAPNGCGLFVPKFGLQTPWWGRSAWT